MIKRREKYESVSNTQLGEAGALCTRGRACRCIFNSSGGLSRSRRGNGRTGRRKRYAPYNNEYNYYFIDPK